MIEDERPATLPKMLDDRRAVEQPDTLAAQARDLKRSRDAQQLV
jgi:hypothetical protein